MIAVGCAPIPAGNSPHQALLLHQPDHPLPTDMDVLLLERIVDARASVVLPAQSMRLVHQPSQPVVLQVMIARRSILPCIES